ncbi:MAG: pitrilysin family protein [Candidatus Neomarinimicrobiota bacterium]
MSRIPLTISCLLAMMACSQPAQVETTEFIVDGLQVIFKHTPGNPVVATGLFLRGGTNYVGSRQAGIEKFMLEAARGGTETRGKDELNAELESLGTSLDVLAEYDYTAIGFQCLLDGFQSSWNLFTDVILHPRFDPRELELVRQRMVAAIAAEDEEPSRYAHRVANELYYEGHPYGVSVNGMTTSIVSLTRKDLIQYHRGDFTKNRMLLVILGDLEEPDITRKARELARQLPLGPELRLPSLTFSPGKADLAVAQRRLASHYILGLFDAPRPGDPDYPAFTAATRILSNRLSEDLRSKHGLTTELSAGASNRIANHGYLMVTTTEPNRTLRAIFQTIDEVILDPIPEKQLKDVLTSSVTRYLLDNESAVNQLLQLAMWEIVGEAWEKGDQYLPEIGELSPEDIQVVLRKYMRNIHFGVVGNRQQVSEQLFTSR